MPPLNFTCGLIIAGMPILLDYIWEQKDLYSLDARPTQNPNYWIYSWLCFGLNLIYTFINLAFMNIAVIDASRKNMMMERMSQVLDLSFHAKDEITIRLPVFNLVDPESIVTWIELRKLILQTGSRFQVRI
jgi:hypothetical protein